MKTLKKVLIAVVIFGILPSVILAIGHNIFGTELIGMQQYQVVDQYVFFLQVAMVTVGALYYMIRRMDLSQSLMIVVSGLYFLFFGWEDFFVYLIHPSEMVGEMSWLNNGVIAWWSQNILGNSLPVMADHVYAVMFSSFILLYLPLMYVLFKLDHDELPI